MITALPNPSIGIYEKALPSAMDWHQRLQVAGQAGFNFVEISIDPSPERLSRLAWPACKRHAIRRWSEDLGLPILTMCLSAHRQFPLGSASVGLRQHGLDIMRRAIDLAFDLGVRILQVAGYDIEDGVSTPASQALYVQGVRQAVAWASGSALMLGLENQEAGFIDSPSRAVEVIKMVDSPYLKLYMDIGNLVVNERDVLAEMTAAQGHLVGVHIKDARPGQPRRVPLGTGLVPFDKALGHLAQMDYHGPFLIEMWNDDHENSIAICKNAKLWLQSQLEVAWGGQAVATH